MAGLVAWLAVAVYLLLPALFAGHVLASHPAELPAAVAGEDGEAQGSHHHDDGLPEHCDLCRFVSTLTHAPGLTPDATAVAMVQPVPVGRVAGIDLFLLGRVADTPAVPRGPPVV